MLALATYPNFQNPSEIFPLIFHLYDYVQAGLSLPFSFFQQHHHIIIIAIFFINTDFHILVTFLLEQLPHDQPQGRKPQPEILSVTWDKNVRAKRQQKKKQQQRLKHMDRHYGARPTNQDPPELATDWVSDSVWFQKQGRGRLLLNSVVKKRQRCRQISLQLAFFGKWPPVVTQKRFPLWVLDSFCALANTFPAWSDDQT